MYCEMKKLDNIMETNILESIASAIFILDPTIFLVIIYLKKSNKMINSI